MLSKPSYRLLVCALFTSTVGVLACSGSVTAPNTSPELSASSSSSAVREAERRRRAADSVREDSVRGREREAGEDSVRGRDGEAGEDGRRGGSNSGHR